MIEIKISKNQSSTSKLFGTVDIPEKWLEEGEFSPTEIFFCQIDLGSIKDFTEGLLPDSGYLYFFIDFEAKPVKGIVRYARSADAYTEFNEGCELDYDVETEVPIDFAAQKNGANGLLCEHKKLYKNEVCLLKFTPNSLDGVDFLCDTDGSIMFVIDIEDLKNENFSATTLINL